MNFKECNLISPILRALDEQGYTQPTAIQAGAIPPALEGRDVLGIARTGTGKTCAFATPILQRLSQNPNPAHPIRALILTPTRELAIQNQECFEAYGKYLDLTSVVIFGGVGQKPQVDAIQKGADILVATPGRLEDLHQQGVIDVSQLEIFVLDEADRMLDMGFIHDVKRILKWLPQKKQTLFFSATMPTEITELVNSLLHRPAKVAVDPVNSAVDSIRQRVYQVDRTNKTKLLVHLLENQDLSSVLVFTRTKHGANKVSKDLTKAGISSAAIHGNKSQTARQDALSGFKAGEIRVLVATDIAARGLDIEDLACVVNYNLPEVPETYVHRIGRTGRAGKGGIAIALCDYQERPLLKAIEKLMKKQVPEVKDHPFPMENFEEAVRDKHGKLKNPEDEEARAAARERKAAEKSAKSVEKSEKSEKPAKSVKAEKTEKPEKDKNAKKRKKQGEPQDGGGQTAQSTPAPEKAEKKGKKAKKSKALEPIEPLAGIVPIPDLLPPREEETPIGPEQRFDSNDIFKRKYKRPEKKVIPSLSSVSLLPTIELKETFGKRDDFMKSARPTQGISGDDATSRMFSQRKEIPERFRPEPPKQEEPAPKAPKQEKKSAQKPKKKANEPKKPEPIQESPSKRVVFSVAKDDGKKNKRPAKAEPAEAPVKAVKVRKSAEKPQKKQNPPAKKPAAKHPVLTEAPQPSGGLRRSRPFVPGQTPAPTPSRQKDSTEQESLMKPYYISDWKKD